MENNNQNNGYGAGNTYANSNGMMDGIGGTDASAENNGQQNYAQQNPYGQNPYEQNTAANAGGAPKRYASSAYENPNQFATAGAYTPINERMKHASQENVALGIVGALIGTALGLVVWCLIGMAGYISAIGGLALVAGAFFGYLLCAKDIGKTGMLIVGVLVVIAVFIGTRLTYAIDMHKLMQEETETIEFAAELLDLDIDPDDSTFEIFSNFGQYVEDFDEIASFGGDAKAISKEYHGNLALGYVFTVAASFAFIDKRRKG